MSAPAPYLSAYDSREGLVAAAEGHYVLAAEAEIVAEAASPSTASQDRVEKHAAYARAGIPLHLLLPAPFGIDLDTSDLPVP
ncbi:hypothetical protein [Streptomyces sp. NPDC056491]|uniref:hypothetical protein n=1 Tax=Streptomyces sp. NPDC056491 TaxID=3345837 RepID=UPI0036C302A2